MVIILYQSGAGGAARFRFARFFRGQAAATTSASVGRDPTFVQLHGAGGGSRGGIAAVQRAHRDQNHVGAASLLVPYSVAVIGGYQDFGLAIVAYAPATLFLLSAFVNRLRKESVRYWLPDIAGLVLTAIAAVLQQLGAGLRPEYFNHNAFYHAIQVLALWPLYNTARSTLAP